MLQAVVQRKLSEEVIADLYPRYADAWSALLVEASARHLLGSEEFRQEMIDERLEKYTVIDENGRVVAMTTLTDDLAAIPWINPVMYRTHYPDEAKLGTVFYLGYTFVDNEHRRSPALALMSGAVNERLLEARGVVGFDMCGHNVRHGIGRHLERLFSSSTQVSMVDTQTYFVADYRTPRRLRDLRTAATSYRLTTVAEHPELIDDVRSLLFAQWPTFMLLGHPAHDVDLEGLLLGLADRQVLLLDNQETVCGAGFMVPLRWDEDPATLPSGWDESITAAAELVRDGSPADVLCAISITVAKDRVGTGIAGRLLGGMKSVAARCGARSVITPIRPTSKVGYPLIPMEQYLKWTNHAGDSFDPWIRFHRRLGGDVLGIAATSMVITGSVVEWETWLGVPLPGDGDYTIEGGLAPLRIDRTADTGRYVEPNVWVRHSTT